jgi:hypothetical protein
VQVRIAAEEDLSALPGTLCVVQALRSHHRPVVYFTGVGALIGAALWTWASGTPLKKVGLTIDRVYGVHQDPLDTRPGTCTCYAAKEAETLSTY